MNAHVDEVLVEGGRAAGVKLRGGSSASKSVVSNASLWDTQRLLPGHVITPKMQKEAQVRSWMQWFRSCTYMLDGHTDMHLYGLIIPQVAVCCR